MGAVYRTIADRKFVWHSHKKCDPTISYVVVQGPYGARTVSLRSHTSCSVVVKWNMHDYISHIHSNRMVAMKSHYHYTLFRWHLITKSGKSCYIFTLIFWKHFVIGICVSIYQFYRIFRPPQWWRYRNKNRDHFWNASIDIVYETNTMVGCSGQNSSKVTRIKCNAYESWHVSKVPWKNLYVYKNVPIRTQYSMHVTIPTCNFSYV